MSTGHVSRCDLSAHPGQGSEQRIAGCRGHPAVRLLADAGLGDVVAAKARRLGGHHGKNLLEPGAELHDDAGPIEDLRVDRDDARRHNVAARATSSASVPPIERPTSTTLSVRVARAGLPFSRLRRASRRSGSGASRATSCRGREDAGARPRSRAGQGARRAGAAIPGCP